MTRDTNPANSLDNFVETQISPRERVDSELFYMSTIMQQGIVPDEVRSKSHYHWNSLRES